MADYNAYPGGYFLGMAETFGFTAGSDLSENTLCTAGRLRGFTRQAFKSGERAVAFLSGKMSHYNLELEAAASAAITQGTEVYLTSAGKVTTSASGNTLFGCLYQAVAVGDTFADVLLYNPLPADNAGLTTAEVNTLIDAKIATHAALTAGTASGNVHPGPAE